MQDDRPGPPKPRTPTGDAERGDPQPLWLRLLAPFRSEGAAFRLLLVVAAVCGVIIAVVLLARAL